jgi:glycosyltransferase involved in cell wall biosynthesis
MRASVIVRTRDEAHRLRLVLASLARQSVAAEIVVVNDGARDFTRDVVARSEGVSVYIEHERPAGRAAAANAGAARAGGDVLIFMDGDTLAAPGLVAAHLAAHGGRAGVAARGETMHLRRTRDLADPETGLPMPGQEARLARLPAAERARLRVTMADVCTHFAALEAAAGDGIYPGAGPRKLAALELEALRRHPDCEVLWAAASGANMSVDARAFRQVGGFHPGLSINEHRELALRLMRDGVRMVAADGARSLHMIHRRGWRDPLVDTAWESEFYRLHRLPAVALLAVFWRGLTEAILPAAARIGSLPELAEAARCLTHVTGIEAVRRVHVQQSAQAEVPA